MTVTRKGPLGRTTARVGPAAAVLRRVGLASLTAGADPAVSGEVSLGSIGCGHLGPTETGELPGHGRGHDRLHVLTGGQGAEAADRRTCALQARATVAALTSAWRALMVLPIAGQYW